MNFNFLKLGKITFVSSIPKVMLKIFQHTDMREGVALGVMLGQRGDVKARRGGVKIFKIVLSYL